jgi:nitrogen regulatory protein P-II 1
MLPKEQRCLHQNLVTSILFQVVVPNDKENEAVELIRANSKMGKIFISPVSRAVDIESGMEGEQAV